MEIKYELSFECDDWLLEKINAEWSYALDEVEETAIEEEIFEIALAYALVDDFALGYNEREAIMAQSHEIYKWWKENAD